MSSSNATADFCATIKWETEGALLLTDGINEFWIPKKAIIEQDPIGDGSDGNFEFVIPERLAIEKGII